MTSKRSAQEIIDDIMYSRGEYSSLAAELVQHGDAAVDAIFDVVKRTTVGPPYKLLSVLAMAASPAKLEELLRTIESPIPEIATTASLALGHMGDRIAAVPLAERLLNPEWGYLAATVVDEALVRMADPRVAELMRARVDHWLGLRRELKAGWIELLNVRQGFDLIWPATIASVLAANGDQRGAPLVFDIVSLPKARRKALSQGFELHNAACKLLMHFAGPGLLDAIQAGAKQGGNDTKQILARVLGHIGTRDAIDVLVSLSSTKHAETSEALASWLTTLAAADLPEVPLYGEAIQSWWKKQRSNFSQDTNYQQGRPWRVDDLFDQISETNDIADHELLIVTGINIMRETRVRKATKADAVAELREESRHRFKEGRLYRHGHEVDPRSCALPLE